MQHIGATDRAYLISFDRHNIQCMSVSAENFEFVTLMFTVNHDDYANVPSFKLILWKVNGEHNPFMFFDHSIPPMDRWPLAAS